MYWGFKTCDVSLTACAGSQCQESAKISSPFSPFPLLDPGFVSMSRWDFTHTQKKSRDEIRRRSVRLRKQSLMILEVMCALLRILFLLATVHIVRKQMAQQRAESLMPL